MIFILFLKGNYNYSKSGHPEHLFTIVASSAASLGTSHRRRRRLDATHQSESRCRVSKQNQLVIKIIQIKKMIYCLHRALNLTVSLKGNSLELLASRYV